MTHDSLKTATGGHMHTTRAHASLLLALPAVLALLACKGTAPSATDLEPEAETPVSAPAPREPTVRERLDSAQSLEPALAVISPHFTDAVDTVSPAGAAFAVWAAKRLTWAELASLPKTTFAAVMKDPEAGRGKRLCQRGYVIEIQADRSAGPTMFVGGLGTRGGRIVRFVAVQDTGDLVENSPARLCGVVIGRQSYANSAGGTAHAIFVVGMFDLAANRGDQR
jgi:hypothetical protein